MHDEVPAIAMYAEGHMTIDNISKKTKAIQEARRDEDATGNS